LYRLRLTAPEIFIVAGKKYDCRSSLATMFTRCLVLASVTLLPLSATVIDFEAQAINSGGNLTGIPDSPLKIGIATFSGGELRQAELAINADDTGVYASQGMFGSGETNPVIITFDSPVSGFSILVANGDIAQSYTVSDDLGDSETLALTSASNSGRAVFALSGTSISKVEIASANVTAWNFAIDSATFTPLTPAPEPQSLVLVGVS
jgi:hypothetical protein